MDTGNRTLFSEDQKVALISILTACPSSPLSQEWQGERVFTSKRIRTDKDGQIIDLYVSFHANCIVSLANQPPP